MERLPREKSETTEDRAADESPLTPAESTVEEAPTFDMSKLPKNVADDKQVDGTKEKTHLDSDRQPLIEYFLDHASFEAKIKNIKKSSGIELKTFLFRMKENLDELSFALKKSTGVDILDPYTTESGLLYAMNDNLITEDLKKYYPGDTVDSIIGRLGTLESMQKLILDETGAREQNESIEKQKQVAKQAA